eukprot:TRINITY_DN2829_c0_g1_i2.p1 TRINITY_DN2829_c0_g1~~TRINITY_DN2829_c0_g1_i2.p1  ORF type:complete len:215 (-),score=38.45 TRINITY_DN2829_c0_g1_i2:13-657(-)
MARRLFAKEIKGVIFDLDGTLTKPVIDFKRLRSRLGVPPGTDIIDFAKQRPTEEEKKTAWDIIEDEERIGTSLLELNPGALELLQFLQTKRIRQGIVTRNSPVAVQHFLSYLSQHMPPPFDPILTRDFAGGFKPSPAPIHHICEGWGISTDQVIMVGDSIDDMLSGHRAGAYTMLLRQDVNQKIWQDPSVQCLMDRLDEAISHIEESIQHAESI